MSVTPEKINEISQKYGHMGSWAVWKDKDIKEKSNVGDLSIFTEISPSVLNINTVFVGLNISQKITKPFGNFHSESSFAHDYKIRYALKDTPFWGAYMTDIIKDFEEKVSGNVIKYLNNNYSFLVENIKSFEDELSFIGTTNPIIIAFGNDCYKILNKHLQTYNVYRISHYSSCVTKEELRTQIHEIIEQIKAL